jgi:hypothetical protein
MNQTSIPSGDAPSCVPSELSQWLYLHIALGKGYIAPFAYTPCWVLSSAVPEELCDTMRTAENEFHDIHEKSIASLRQRLEALEASVQATKRAQGASVPQAVTVEIKQLREKLAMTAYVNYRDWTADRSTMMEMLSKSKFRAMSFVDEIGVRAHGYTINKFLAAKNIFNDLALLSLSGDKSADSVLIRSSATGGANIVSVRGGDAPRFNLMTLTSAQAIGKIMSRIAEAAPAKGKTLPIIAYPGPCIPVQASQITKVITKVYATDNPANRITVETSQAWADFLAMRDHDVGSASEAAATAVAKSMTSVRLLVTAIARAVITRKIFLTEPDLPGSDTSDRVVLLDDNDLALAQNWFREMHVDVFNLKFRSARLGNAEKARTAWMSGPSVESVLSAKTALIKALQEDEHGTMSLTAAFRLAGVTERVLDQVLQDYPTIFVVLDQHRRPGAKRMAAKSIQLAEGWDSQTDSVGGEESWQPGSQLSDQVVDSLYQQWQSEAEANMTGPLKRPVIEVAELPASLMPAAIAVQRRYWQSTALIPSGPKKAIDKQVGLELWFRFKPGGDPMCAWKESYLEWKVAEKWEAKDDEAQSRRETDGFSMSSKEGEPSEG